MKNTYLIYTLLSLFFCNSAQAQWQRIPGPSGVQFQYIAADGPKLYGSSPNQLFESIDDGYTWTKVPNAARPGGMRCLLIDNDKWLMERTNSFVYSLDKGISWKQFSNYAPRPYPVGISIAGAGETVVLIDTAGIITSTDFGQTWQRPLENEGDTKARHVLRWKGNYYLRRGGQIMRSPDGLNWQAMLDYPERFQYFYATDDWLIAESRLGDRAVFSKDGFDTFTETTIEDLGFWSGHEFIYTFTDSGDTLYLVNINTNNYPSCNKSWKYSTNGGKNWEIDPMHEDLNTSVSQVFDLGNRNLIIDSRGGPILHTSGNYISQVFGSKGPEEYECNSIHRAGAYLYVTCNNRAYRTSNFGQNWEPAAATAIPAPNCMTHAYIAQTNQNLLVGDYWSTAAFSDNQGSSWAARTDLINYWPGTKTALVTYDGERNIGVLRDGEPTPQSYSLAEVFQDTGRIYFVYPLGNYMAVHTTTNNLYIVNDRFDVFRSTQPPCNLGVWGPKRFAYFDGKNLMYSCGDEAYVMLDGSNKWTPATLIDVTTGDSLAYTIDNQIGVWNDRVWMAFADGNIFYSTDAIGNYQRFDPPFDFKTPIRIDIAKDTVWLASDFHGIYYHTLVNSLTPEPADQAFRVFPSLGSQVQLVTITTDKPSSLNTQLRVFDASGHLVSERNLLTSNRWNVSIDVPSPGLYLLQLTDEFGVRTLKYLAME